MTDTTPARTSDLTVQWRTFGAIGVFVALLATVYWFASYDYAGTVMLGLASALALLDSAYLFWQQRSGHGHGADAAAAPDEETQYLPHASVWPFGIGIGAFLAFNGLVLGFAYMVPGAIVIGASIAGLILQSRRRT
jgi:hypothetical protein